MKLVEAIQQGESGTNDWFSADRPQRTTPVPLWNLVVSAIQRFLLKVGGGQEATGLMGNEEEKGARRGGG